MHTGMLRFDTDPNTNLLQKIQKAMAYYESKWGKKPNLCLVHPNMLDGSEKEGLPEKLTLRPYRPVTVGHFWIGIEEVDPAIVKAQAHLEN